MNARIVRNVLAVIAMAAAVALLVVGPSGPATAGAYIGAGEFVENRITHPETYNGTGGVVNISLCIRPTSAFASQMVASVQNNVTTLNALVGTSPNLIFGSANNIPGGFVDFESVLIHEVGHAIGLAHVNHASESGLGGSQANGTKSTNGPNNVFNQSAGADFRHGSRDDLRGDDGNLHWFDDAANDPCNPASPAVVDRTTMSRTLGDLPAGHLYAANSDRNVCSLLGYSNTEGVMQQGSGSDEDQRRLGGSDVRTLRLAMAGLDEIQGTADDYTMNFSYAGITNSCDIPITFDNSVSFAATFLSTTTIAGQHRRAVNPSIRFNTGFNWFFNTASSVCGDGTVDGGEQCDDGNTTPGDGCSATCQTEVCGNATIDPGEQCDDGNTNSGDGCSATCRNEFCGDGVRQGSEQCDDGNTINGDGCDSNCIVETCGNGVLQVGELCDDGNLTSGDGCSATCVPEFCGDEVVQAGLGEECDDGDTINGDGCDENCIVETCGNGVVQAGEECDDGNTNDLDTCSNACTANAVTNQLTNGDFSAGTSPWIFFTDGGGSYQVVGGEARLSFTAPGRNVQLYQRGVAAESNTGYTISFRARHTLANSNITVRFGNHVSPFQSYGFSRSVVLTTSMTTYSFDFDTTSDLITNGRLTFLVGSADAPGSNIFIDDVVLRETAPDACGNGALDAGEVCDGFNLAGETCGSQGFDGGSLACNATCSGFVTDACFGCGDGVVDAGEVCDGDDLDGESCVSQGFDGGNLTCNASCNGFVTSGCSTCGDGVVGDGEQCDDGNTAGGDGCSGTCQIEGGGTNLITNGDFSSGTAPWVFYTNGSGSYQVVGGEARLSFVSNGSNVQLYQRGIAADGTTDYTLTFRARHTLAGRRITVRFAKHGAPYTFYGLSQRVTLSTSMQTYSLEFTTTSDVITDARLMFLVSDADTPGSQIYIDDVALAPSAPDTCGNGTLDFGEVCDGFNLDGESCASQGFDGGSLACNATCSGFVTDACFGCGDGVVDGGEVCDGNDLDGETCVSQGFDGGDLGCNASCNGFVTGGCSTCGDGVVGGGEQCDDGNTVSGDGCSGSCQVEGGATNLISNGNFSSGTSNWSFASNGNSSFSVVGGQGFVDVNSPGTSVQLYQRRIVLQPGTTYRLTFRGRNTGGDNVRVRMIRHTSPYSAYGLDRVVDLTPATQTFSMTFTTPGGSLAEARLQFWIAPYDSAGDDYYFDDVVLEAL